MPKRPDVDPLSATHCPYCMQQTKLVKGDRIYKGRPDLASQWFWLCEPCDAYVGCHKPSRKHGLNGKEPLGRLADANLRRWRRRAHKAFDPLWRDTSTHFVSRSMAYTWLAQRMGIDKELCHIGHFDEERCKQVIDICKEFRSPSCKD